MEAVLFYAPKYKVYIFQSSQIHVSTYVMSLFLILAIVVTMHFDILF